MTAVPTALVRLVVGLVPAAIYLVSSHLRRSRNPPFGYIGLRLDTPLFLFYAVPRLILDDLWMVRPSLLRSPFVAERGRSFVAMTRHDAEPRKAAVSHLAHTHIGQLRLKAEHRCDFCEEAVPCRNCANMREEARVEIARREQILAGENNPLLHIPIQTLRHMAQLRCAFCEYRDDACGNCGSARRAAEIEIVRREYILEHGDSRSVCRCGRAG